MGSSDSKTTHNNERTRNNIVVYSHYSPKKHYEANTSSPMRSNLPLMSTPTSESVLYHGEDDTLLLLDTQPHFKSKHTSMTRILLPRKDSISSSIGDDSSRGDVKSSTLLHHTKVRFTQARVIYSNNSAGLRVPTVLYSYSVYMDDHHHHSGGNNTPISPERTWKEFVEFQERLLVALENGHSCTSYCPWLFHFIKTFFPRKRHWFHAAHNSNIVSKRLSGLQVFFDNLLQAAGKCGKRSCPIVCTVFPNELLSFLVSTDDKVTRRLYKRMEFKHQMLPSQKHKYGDERYPSPCCSEGSSSAATETFIIKSPTENSSSRNRPPLSSNFICTLCDINDSSESTISTGTTRLECGHSFHDECILAYLNRKLECPLCGKKVGK